MSLTELEKNKDHNFKKNILEGLTEQLGKSCNLSLRENNLKAGLVLTNFDKTPSQYFRF